MPKQISSLSNINITLTDFMDFVNKAGGTKITKVKQLKTRPEYHPAQDFYKSLREGLIEIHQHNGTKDELLKIVSALTDDKKKKNYPDMVDGYKRFWGKKNITWFTPPNRIWKLGQVQIKINPELGLIYDGQHFVIKLHLRSDKISKDKVSQVLCLMESQLRKKVADTDIFCLLDVKNGKLFRNDSKDTSYMPLLEGEAKSLETLWNGI